MSKIDVALEIAVKAHAGMLDKDGEAYILHPLAVGLMGKTDEERMTGFLHDVLEDSDYTPEALLDLGIPDSVVNAVVMLTRDKKVPYSDYVQQIIDSHNPIALMVKFYDLTHNYGRSKNYPALLEKDGTPLRQVKAAVDDLNSISLYLSVKGTSYAIFAAGCFWGVQHYFQRQKGVLRTFVGFTGGKEEMPTYEDVRTHKTSHVEAVLVEYDPNIVVFEDLCKLFFEIHDPAQTDGQGPDKGSQYLSGAFYTSAEQKETIEKLVKVLRDKGFEVNTRVEAAGKFWIAEQYHQNYYDNTGGSPYCHFRTKKF